MRGGVSTRDAEGGDESDLRGGSTVARRLCGVAPSNDRVSPRRKGSSVWTDRQGTPHHGTPPQNEPAERHRRQSDKRVETKRRGHRP